MSRSIRKHPIWKIKDRWFQKYCNRRERRKTKEHLGHGRFEMAESETVPHSTYDVIDQVANGYTEDTKDWLNQMNERELKSLLSK